MSSIKQQPARAVRPGDTLRRFVAQAVKAAGVEHCELCSAPLAAEHSHLVECETRRLVCACEACAVLFDQPAGGRFKRVPRSGRYLSDFALSDADWDELLIPINMAFFFESSAAGRVVAIYPSPAGATESLLTLSAWRNLVAANPVLRSMQADVEALLVNRLGPARGFEQPRYYLAPIDECYKLVGLIRTHWRGLSGGSEVWPRITDFFAQLNERSGEVRTTDESPDVHSF